MQSLKLIDRFHRHINYLRISITDRCNLKCVYCVPRELVPKLSHEEILSYEEILRLVRIGTRMGISKVRVTGGDPLVRNGVYEFLKALTAIPKLRDVSLTTNGVFLRDNLQKIQDAGIKRLNISMDTLNREKFKVLSGRDAFDRVWEGIRKAERMGFSPIKLNVVALRGINEDELIDLAALSYTHPFHIRFIEYMPIGERILEIRKPLLAPEIQARIETLGRLIPVQTGTDDGPARRFRLDGAMGEVGFISALSHHFCGTCNRLRLTADGQLRPCLLSDIQEDIKGPLRSGCSDRELSDIFLKTVRYKQSGHHLAGGDAVKVNGQMSCIGG